MLSWLHHILLHIEIMIQQFSPVQKRLFFFFMVLTLLGAEVVWEGVQETRHAQEVESLSIENRQLRQQIHTLVKLNVAQEMDFLRDSVR